jgi:hypothetical protein
MIPLTLNPPSPNTGFMARILPPPKTPVFQADRQGRGFALLNFSQSRATLPDLP